jgi:ATP-dependent helicase YprA (DUF1998 family)
LRVVAASATISNPAEHLYALTGLQFESINEASDASPQHSRRVFHLAATPGDESSLAADLQKSLLSSSDTGSFITFIDSRQGAERLAIKTDADAVVQLCGRIAAATKAQIVVSLKRRCATARFAESFQLPLWSLESIFHISAWD